MPKKPNSRSKPVKRSDPMTGAMKFFLAGCVAELYLLIIRRFYVNGDALQQIAWYDVYLKVFAGIGAAVLVAGLILAYVWRKSKKQIIGGSLAGIGAFLAVASLLVRWNMSALSILTVVVPVVMLLGILWSLYDRECALALTILAVSLMMVWICRRGAASAYVGTYVKVLAVAYLVVLAAVVWLVKTKKLTKLVPANADLLAIYVACGLSAVALVVALISSGFAYYAMWGLAAVVFGLAVYYTVKQL